MSEEAERKLELVTALRSFETTLVQCVTMLKRKHDRTQATEAKTRSSDQSLANASEDDNASVTREEKVPVSIRVVFLKVGEIDTLRDRYTADVLIQARWKEPKMDGCTYLQTQEPHWNSYWNPRLFVENIYGEAKESVWYALHFDDDGVATVTERRRINGSFFEYMELNQFPFDTQDLTVTLATERGEDEIEFVEDAEEKCAINGQSFVDEQEWHLHSYIHTWQRTVAETFGNSQIAHPAFSAACKASRRPGFFIWNILVVMFLICSMSFGTFAVKPDLPQNRLQLSFILLLTTVSFKFVVNQSLPMISYLTYLDKYILGSMAILCCICVWHAVIPFIMSTHGSASALTADTVALVILALTYIALHVAFIGAVILMGKLKFVIPSPDKVEENVEAVHRRDSTETVLSGQNGNIPAVLKETPDRRGTRNMVEAATTQTVISAWQ